VRYPNLRYGNPTELAYYAAFWGDVARLAKFLRRDQRTVRDWLSGRARVPWWVPEMLRLKRMEAELRHQQMGMGALAPRLGVVSGNVITLARPQELTNATVPVFDAHATGKEFDLGVKVMHDF
jgi:hypothetical protein